MRVAIDATPLLVRSAGVKNYLYYWIEHLRRFAGDDVIRTVPAAWHAWRPLHSRCIRGGPSAHFPGIGRARHLQLHSAAGSRLGGAWL